MKQRLAQHWSLDAKPIGPEETREWVDTGDVPVWRMVGETGPGSSGAVPEAGQWSGLDVPFFLRVVRRQWKVIALVSFVAAMLVTYCISRIPDRYTAITLVQVGRDDLQLSSGPPRPPVNADDEVEVLKSDQMVRAVVGQLHLGDDALFAKAPTNSLLGRLRSKVAGLLKGLAGHGSSGAASQANGETPDGDKTVAASAPGVVTASRTLQQMVSVQRRGMTNIIAVKVDAANAASAARIANAYAKVYVDREFQSKNATMTSVEDALQRRIDTLSVALQKPDAQSFLREEYLDDLAELRALAKRRSMIVSEADVVSKAYPPANPSFPPRLMFLMAGWIVSLGLGAGAGWFLDKGRRGVRSARDLEHFVGVPNVLEVPFAAESPRHRIGLAHRKRRRDWGCGLAALGRGDLVLEMLQVSAQRMKSVLVTSVHSGEGKSTVALALGRAAAGEGAKVVILDCDVHTPGLRRDFNLHDPNLEEALAGIDKDSDKLQLHSDPLSNCLICTCGQLAPGAASRVFRSPEFRTLIRGLSARFDLVLIDGPSSGTNFSEVVPLSWVADLTLLLARFEMTPLSDVQAAVRNLARVSGSKFATGLNAVRGTGHGQI